MIKKLSTGIATVAILATAVAPVAFADMITVNGNGDHSSNTVVDTSEKTVAVTQSNSSEITVGVSSEAKTGGNQNNSNTGGISTINTGDANSTVASEVTGSSNTTSKSNCGCNLTPDTVNVNSNGQSSSNTIVLNKKKTKTKTQLNESAISLLLESIGKTGHNQNNGNTGGSSSINTGFGTTIIGSSITGSANSF